MKQYLFLLFLVCAAPGALAQDCSKITFAPGASSGEISGRVTEEKPMCFTFASGEGQVARLQLSESNNICFTVYDVVDCQDDFSFRTQNRDYTVLIAPFVRIPDFEEFTLRLTIK
ncbi:hypothetical protein [Roseibium aggregatum]|uniref:Uncharacterized protein n=1 Tax=Roseibium aggregatum TaxID=187304 RepID=A0A0M6YD21_9HYPH|nr:hypothetical protein [Roseibium aggregatum]CTQ47604.1 hypothetical protein LAL4801_06066 [Roseibium aggregatum]